MSTPFLVCRQPPSLCVLRWRRDGEIGSLPLLIRALFPSSGSTLMTSSNLNHPKAPPSQYHPTGGQGFNLRGWGKMVTNSPSKTVLNTEQVSFHLIFRTFPRKIPFTGKETEIKGG